MIKCLSQLYKIIKRAGYVVQNIIYIDTIDTYTVALIENGVKNTGVGLIYVASIIT